MVEARIGKLVMVAGLAGFAGLVTLNNLVDYGSNFAFVRHVLSMDTTFPGNALTGRAITAPALWHAAYILIVALEALTCLAFACGAFAMARHLRGHPAEFRRALRFVWTGAGLAFLLWFIGFMVVGGEWFAMWQSRDWNGQQAAFRFYVTAMLVLLVVALPEEER